MLTLKEAIRELLDKRRAWEPARFAKVNTPDLLKPCPFCGGVAEYDNSDGGPYEWVQCTNCGAQGPGANYNESGLEAALTAWNSRKETPDAVPVLPPADPAL